MCRTNSLIFTCECCLSEVNRDGCEEYQRTPVYDCPLMTYFDIQLDDECDVCAQEKQKKKIAEEEKNEKLRKEDEEDKAKRERARKQREDRERYKEARRLYLRKE